MRRSWKKAHCSTPGRGTGRSRARHWRLREPAAWWREERWRSPSYLRIFAGFARSFSCLGDPGDDALQCHCQWRKNCQDTRGTWWKRYRQGNRQDFRKPAVESDSWQILSSKTLFSHVTRRPRVTAACLGLFSGSVNHNGPPLCPSLPFPLVLGTDSLHSGSLTTHSTRSFNPPTLTAAARPVTPVL